MFAQTEETGFFNRIINLFPSRKIKREQLKQLGYLLQKAVSDGVITDQEISEIERFYRNSDLTKEQFDQVKSEVLNELVAKYCADRRVTEQEEASLKQIATRLGFSQSSLEALDQHINFFSLMHIVETEPFDRLPAMGGSGIILQPGEIAYLSMAASLLEERVVRREIVGRSHGFSIPIVKGVRYRVGQARGHLVSETGIVPVSTGKFTVTNKRLVFAGDKKSFNSAFNKLLDIQLYSDGLRLSVTSRQKPVYIQFFTQESTELIAAYIYRVMNR